MSEEPKQNKGKKLLIALMVSLAFASVGTILILEIDNQEKSITDVLTTEPIREEFNRFQCEQWIEEGKFLVAKNSPEKDIKKWSLEDFEKIQDLEKNVLDFCTVTREDIDNDNFNLCYDYYFSIRILLNKMTDNELNSLSEDDQALYKEKYSAYHKNNCPVVQDELEAIFNLQ